MEDIIISEWNDQFIFVLYLIKKVLVCLVDSPTCKEKKPDSFDLPTSSLSADQINHQMRR